MLAKGLTKLLLLLVELLNGSNIHAHLAVIFLNTAVNAALDTAVDAVLVCVLLPI